MKIRNFTTMFNAAKQMGTKLKSVNGKDVYKCNVTLASNSGNEPVQYLA